MTEKTILITAIGGDIGQGVAKVLREAFLGCRLIGTDVHSFHGGALYVDECCVIPRATDAYYKEAIHELVSSKAVDIVIPISEQEIGVWYQESLDDSPAQWVMSGPRAVHVGLDKYITAQELATLGVEVPWTRLVCDDSPIDLPCIIKDRAGSGSKNVFIVKDQEDVNYFASKYPDSIYQELLLPAEREVTCAVYRTKDNRVSVYQMRRILTGGLTGWAQIIDDHAVRDMCEIVAEGLDLRGSMNVQLRITSEGPRIFEINPRFSSTTLMRHRLGFTDLVWVLQELEGLEIEFPVLEAGEIAVRTFDTEILK